MLPILCRMYMMSMMLHSVHDQPVLREGLAGYDGPSVAVHDWASDRIDAFPNSSLDGFRIYPLSPYIVRVRRTLHHLVIGPQVLFGQRFAAMDWI